MTKKIIIFLIGLLPCLYTAKPLWAEEDINPNSTSTKTNFTLLPPIRRVGIGLVQTNVTEFRNFMREQDRLLSGSPAYPYNENDLQKLFASSVENVTKSTGRFWSLSLSDFAQNIAAAKNGTKDADSKNALSALKNKLTVDYNLDAWLKPAVIFSPDETMVRLSLKGIGKPEKTWAREDILLEAQANKEKIQAAFAQALSRLMSTIGHDGQVTYARDNLMTLDFGKERGLERGQKIIAGIVTLSSFHPQSGEFLRSERIPLYQLKVLESKNGSSLCEITDIDKIKLQQMTDLNGSTTLVLLAWKPTDNSNQEGWREPYDPQTAPLLGSVDSGFGVPISKKELPKIPNNSYESKEKVVQKNIAQRSIEEPVYDNQDYAQASNTNGDPHPKRKLKHSVLTNPSTWNILTGEIGLGINLGSFAGGESASFPSFLINRLHLESFVELDRRKEFYLESKAEYAFFNGSNLVGYSSFFDNTFFVSTWSRKAQNQEFLIGGSLNISNGSVNSLLNNVDLFNVETSLVAKWDAQFAPIGAYSLKASFSIFDLIFNTPTWSWEVKVQPYVFMPPELKFDIGMKRYVNDWLEFTLGVNWDFLAGD